MSLPPHTAGSQNAKTPTISTSSIGGPNNTTNTDARRGSRRICHRCKEVVLRKNLKRHIWDICEKALIHKCSHCTYTNTRPERVKRHHNGQRKIPCTNPCNVREGCVAVETVDCEAHYALACCGVCFYQDLSGFLEHWNEHSCSELPEDYNCRRLRGLLEQPNLKLFLENNLIPQLGNAEGLTRFLRWSLETEQSDFLVEQRVAENVIYSEDNVKTAMIIRVLEGCPTRQTPEEHSSDAIRCLGQLLPKFKSTAQTMSAAHTIAQRILNEIGQLQQLIAQMDGIPREKDPTTNTSGSQRSVVEHVAMNGLLVNLEKKVGGLRTLLDTKQPSTSQISHGIEGNIQRGDEDKQTCRPVSQGETRHLSQYSPARFGVDRPDDPLNGAMDDNITANSSLSQAYGYEQLQTGANKPPSRSTMEPSVRDSQSLHFPSMHSQDHMVDQPQNGVSPWNPWSLYRQQGHNPVSAPLPTTYPHLGMPSHDPNAVLFASQGPSSHGDPFSTTPWATPLSSPLPHGLGLRSETAQYGKQDAADDPSLMHTAPMDTYAPEFSNGTGSQFGPNEINSFFLRNGDIPSVSLSDFDPLPGEQDFTATAESQQDDTGETDFNFFGEIT